MPAEPNRECRTCHFWDLHGRPVPEPEAQCDAFRMCDYHFEGRGTIAAPTLPGQSCGRWTRRRLRLVSAPNASLPEPPTP